MEHIVQFAVGIDDEAIKKNVVEHAEKKIIEELTFGAKSLLFQKEYYNSTQLSNRPTSYVNRKLDDILESCRDDIIELAAEKLADRLSRTKRAKEMLEGIANKEKKYE